MVDPRIALGMTALLAIAALFAFWPRNGLIVRWRQARRSSSRILAEDALKQLFAAQLNGNGTGRGSSLQGVAGALYISENRAADVLDDLATRGLVSIGAGGFLLTQQGREYALHVLRAHRLWERHLADETGFSPVQWHRQAEVAEHLLSPAEADQLAAQLGNPTYDPHGDPIPTASGEIYARGGRPLPTLNVGDTVRFVHVEDEPEAVYAQLLAEGVYAGMEAQLLEVTGQRVRFWADGDEHLLAPIVAANITARPLAVSLTTKGGQTLADLEPGEKGTVLDISPRCRGPERNRLFDLGVLPGTEIESEMRSPGGDPTAYRVRGALIALRREQAELIRLTPVSEAPA